MRRCRPADVLLHEGSSVDLQTCHGYPLDGHVHRTGPADLRGLRGEDQVVPGERDSPATSLGVPHSVSEEEEWFVQEASARV